MHDSAAIFRAIAQEIALMDPDMGSHHLGTNLILRKSAFNADGAANTTRGIITTCNVGAELVSAKSHI